VSKYAETLALNYQKESMITLRHWLSTFIVALLTHFTQITQAAPVELQVRPLMQGQAFKGLDVALTFNGAAKGETLIQLPNQWAGQSELYKALRELRAEGATLSSIDAIINASGAPDKRLLRHKPNARITLHYRVVQDADGPPDDKKGNDYRAIFEPSYFHVLGNTLVIQPDSVKDDTPAHFTLTGLPKGASFASDLQHQSMGRKLMFADLQQSVLVGGDFRVIDAGSGARLAIRGEWPQTDAQWREAFTRVATAQRAYWGARSEPYLVTILPLPNTGGLGSSLTAGTGLGDAFAFFATTNAEMNRIVQTLSHEMMHTWVPARIGGMPEKGEALQYWLSEGMTDWASWRVLARSGVWNAESFAAAFNEQLKGYDASSVKTAPNTIIQEKFWTEHEVQKLPYQRGMLMAMHWDHAVMQATQGERSFDDVLLEMQRMSSSRPGQPGPAFVYLKQAMQSVAGLDITPELAQYIDKGEALPLPQNLFAPCGELNDIERAAFHRGFDVDATMANDYFIKGVVADGPAYRAGLRDGMKLVKRAAGEIGNSAVEITYEVKDGEQMRRLSWLPVGTGRVSLRELQINKEMSAAQKQACQKRLGG
jgi:predicted metalloprotease with PDZ domain